MSGPDLHVFKLKFLALKKTGFSSIKNTFQIFLTFVYLYSMQLFSADPKLYIPSTLNIDLILWHTQLILCAENVKSWFKSWVFPFTFQAYILLHTLNCMCVRLSKFHI